jgi:two-component sensor histidine kinase
MAVESIRTTPVTAMSWFSSLRLRERLLLLVALAGLPGIAVAVYLAGSWLQNETAQIELSGERLAKLAAARQDAVIESARLVLTAVVQRIEPHRLDPSICRDDFDGWLDVAPALMSLSLFNREGRRICVADEAELPQDVAETDWFAEAREENGFVLGGYTFGETGRPLLIAAYPIFDDDKAFSGAVGLGVDIHWLDFLSETIDLPEDTTVTAVDEDGEILLHTAKGPTENDANVGSLPSQAAIAQIAAMTTGVLRAENQAGSPRVYGIQKTRSGGVVVAVGHTPYLAYARYWDAMLNTLMAPIMVLLLALAAAGFGSEVLVARYVRSLTRTAEAISDGDLAARSDVPYDLYEIGQLAESFDSMADTLQNDKRRLETLVHDRETLIRELNHRVKNNLQIVLSMMRGAGGELDDPAARARFKVLAGRIQNLAQIHELLYQHYDADVPPLRSYVGELSTLLGEFYEEKVGVADVSGRIDNIDLTIGQCISFGLILNELVANAHKHAFKETDRGEVSIRVIGERSDGQAYVHLIVSDNGAGLPADFSFESAKSTGSRLMRGLTQQLRGEIWSERLERGTAIHVRFPADE